MKNLSFVIQFILILAIIGGQCAGVSAQTSAFNYQGRLTNAGANATGAYQFEFKLFDVPTGGTAIGTISDVIANVSDGIFSVNLDFGETAFDGNARYLQIGVRPSGSTTEYATLTPRQPITAVPYTIKAKKAATAENLSCNGCVQSSHVNSIAGDKIAGSVASADNAAKLNGLSAASYAVVGGNVTFANVSTDALSLTNNGQINNLRLENSATDPAAASAANKGRIYFNTTTNELKMSNGAAWQTVYGVTNTTTPNPVTTRSPKQIATLNWFETPRPINFTFCDEENANCSGVPYLTQMVFTGEHVLTVFSPPGGETTLITYGGIPTLEGIDDAGGTLGFSNPNPNNLKAFSKGITYDGESVYIAYYLSSSLSQNGTGKIVKAAKKPYGSQTANGFNIAVGNNLIPFAMAFDGENVWATWKTGTGSGRVTKVSPSGVILCNLVSFDDPRGLAFDGDNMWVANYGANNVAKIPKACEQLQGKGTASAARPPGGIEFFNTGTKPYAVAFDGANVWVTNSYDGTNELASVGKYRASDGALLSFHQVGRQARGIAFDGTNVWIVNQGLDSNVNGTVTKLRARDGSLVGTYTVGKSPEAIVFDGLRIWVSNYGSNFITRF